MDPSYELEYHRLESSHWWFSARRDMIFRLIKNCSRDSMILEIGCSGGALIEFLKEQGFKNIYGIDISSRAIDLCKAKGMSSISVADAQETGFNDQQFDIIIASDILEHIKDESKAVMEWRRILKCGGKLYAFVPAFEFLWSMHDEANYHYRRYTRASLIDVMERNGFIIKRSSYWNACLFFPIAIMRLIQRFFATGQDRTGGQLQKTGPFINKFLNGILKLENKIIESGINFPFGVSVFTIAERI